MRALSHATSIATATKLLHKGQKETLHVASNCNLGVIFLYVGDVLGD